MCSLIEQEYPGVVCISIGALLRAKIAENPGDSSWNSVKTVMESGGFVGDVRIITTILQQTNVFVCTISNYHF